MHNRNHVPAPEGEVDLLNLVRGLWGEKWLIISLAIIGVMIAGAYLFVAKPVYEAKVFILPPTQNGIADFNYGRSRDSSLEPYTVDDVYAVFLRNLQAESLRRNFFESVFLPSLDESVRMGSQTKLYEVLSRRVTVELPKKELQTAVVTVSSSSPVEAANWASTYVELAGKSSEEEMIKNVTQEAGVIARNINQQITTLRERGQQVREDLMVQLEEALRIAKAIGLERPPIISGSSATEITASMDGELVYMRGSKALEAELENLKLRKSDDPFIPRLRELQDRYELFKSLQVRPAAVQVYRVDGDVKEPDSPIKPKKLLVIALGLFAGLGLGLIVALARYFIRASRGSLGQG